MIVIWRILFGGVRNYVVLCGKQQKITGIKAKLFMLVMLIELLIASCMSQQEKKSVLYLSTNSYADTYINVSA